MRWMPLVLVVVGLGPVAAADPAPSFRPEQVAFYEKEVLPVLTQHCLKCHGADAKKIRGGLNLTTRQGTITGGDTGPAFDAKKPADSLILKAIHFKDGLEMPPTGKLPEKEVAILTRWVNEGLAYPASALSGGTQAHEPNSGPDKNYWAYQPVRRPTVPTVKNTAWVANPIDAFILAKLEAKGLAPVAPAEKMALCRRLYYDLTGLPPTPEQVDAFVKDNSPQAYERLIDTLLASPRYGEKWGRHWLDVVRFAETNGYERDGPKPNAWRYRDYVIRSFNADKPFDQFVREQIAGDEMGRDNSEAIIATGFHRLGVWDDEPADPKQALFDGYDDLVTVTSQGFLGMTMNCCRCHDHKGDYFPQADYYKMLAFFRDIRPFSDTRGTMSSTNSTDITSPERRKLYEAELQAREKQIEELTKKMTVIENEAIKKMPAEDQRASEGPDRPQVVAKLPKFFTDDQKKEYGKLRRERDDLKKKPTPSQEFALSVNNCEVRPPKTNILIRGNASSPGKEVTPGFPSVFGVPDPKIPEPTPGAKTSGRRTILANWLASADNPLTARVIANRVWQWHFGRGIVPTPNDFGKLGEKPTHPELLDWLASELVAQKWSLKKLHKTILLSNTYRLGSTANEANLKADPGNALRWRFDMRRLTAEEVRDSILYASGTLNPKMYGPSVFPKLPKEVLAGISFTDKQNHWPTSSPEESNRRSVYVFVKRSLQVPILIQHDQADTDSSCPVRYTTTVPTQALGMLNGEFTNEQAVLFAKRLETEVPGNLAGQIGRAIRLITGRVATSDEIARDQGFVQRMKTTHQLSDQAALARYALLLLNANEFVYLD